MLVSLLATSSHICTFLNCFLDGVSVSFPNMACLAYRVQKHSAPVTVLYTRLTRRISCFYSRAHMYVHTNTRWILFFQNFCFPALCTCYSWDFSCTLEVLDQKPGLAREVLAGGGATRISPEADDRLFFSIPPIKGALPRLEKKILKIHRINFTLRPSLSDCSQCFIRP